MTDSGKPQTPWEKAENNHAEILLPVPSQQFTSEPEMLPLCSVALGDFVFYESL